MIGFFGVVFFLIFYFLLTSPYILVAMVIEKFNPKLVQQISLNMIKRGGRIVNKIIGVKMTVIGHENVPENEPVLYVGNHRSYFDVMLTYVRVKGLTGYIAKDILGKIPFLHWWMIHANCLFLDRKDIRQGMEVILKAIEYVNDGVSITIFPEGTRNKTGEDMQPFHKGSFKIAQRTGCAIVPMVINNSDDIYEAHRPFVKRGCHIVIEYGKPFYMKDLSKEDQKNIHEYTRNLMTDIYRQNKAKTAG